MTPLQKLINHNETTKLEKIADDLKFAMSLKEAPMLITNSFIHMAKAINEMVDMVLEYETRLNELERRLQEYEDSRKTGGS